MSLNDAYDFVRRKKANISPNFNFMGQLLDFERQLNPPSPQRCTCHLPDTTSTTSTTSTSSPAPAAAAVVGDTPVVIPFTRLSIEEDDDEEDELHNQSYYSFQPEQPRQPQWTHSTILPSSILDLGTRQIQFVPKFVSLV